MFSGTLILLLVISFNMSCGRSKGGGGGVQAPSTDYSAGIVATATDLPPCDTANKGKLIYLKDQAEFQTCDGSEWATINLKGEKGDPGEKGSTGDRGENGSVVPKVYDANGKLLGIFVSFGGASEGAPTGTSSGDTNFINVLLTNGFVMSIYPNNGSFALGNRSNVDSCYFESADCSGTCLTTYSLNDMSKRAKQILFYAPSPVTYGDRIHYFYEVNSDVNVGPKVVNSRGNFSTSSGGCTLVGTPATLNPAFVATKTLDLVSGATYPYAGPLTIGL